METKNVNINGREMTLIRYRNEWVFPYITTYQTGFGAPIALILLSLVETCDPSIQQDLEEYTYVTVNLPDCKRSAGCQFIDVNNNHTDIIEWLEENGFGKRTGRVEISGFCTYPEFNFYVGKTFMEYYKLCMQWEKENNPL